MTSKSKLKTKRAERVTDAYRGLCGFRKRAGTRKIHVSDELLLEAVSAVGRELSRVREYLVWRQMLDLVPRGVERSINRR